MDRPRRVLVAVLVYNGRAFVPRALQSIARLRTTSAHHVDVLVLDDASPDPGWSGELAELCHSLGLGIYRTPRNLGIPRNMNLGLLRTLDGGYDGCVLLNSDVMVADSLVDALVNAADQPHQRIGSVTAWSNDVSIFSLPNGAAADSLTHQPTLDRVAATLHDEFAGATVELPVGCGFCLYIPRPALETTGVMDPVFGRGYAEEVDWCCRAVEGGWKHVLALSAFCYHMGSASTSSAGVLMKGMRTVSTNEAIVDMRHPWYRDALAQWPQRQLLGELTQQAVRRLVVEAAHLRGVVIDATWLERSDAGDPGVDPNAPVRVVVRPDGASPVVEAQVDGWRLDIPVGSGSPLESIAGLLGVAPSQVRLHDVGGVAGRLAVEAVAGGVPVQRLVRYPERV
jgi:GT2 family glycosyltransferase